MRCRGVHCLRAKRVLAAVLRAAAFTTQRSACSVCTLGAIAVAARPGWVKRIATSVAAIAAVAALSFAAQPASAQNAYIRTMATTLCR